MKYEFPFDDSEMRNIIEDAIWLVGHAHGRMSDAETAVELYFPEIITKIVDEIGYPVDDFNELLKFDLFRTAWEEVTGEA